MPSSARPDVRLTYDDFLLFPDDGMRHELIDGEHYVTPSPNRRHQKLLGRLNWALVDHLRAYPAQGEAYAAPFDVVFSHWDVVEPDLLVVTGDQLGILTDKNIVGAPALVVEILSPGTRKRDRTIKRGLFERSGVREYWMVDPDQNTVVVHRRDAAGAFPSAGEFRAEDGAILTTPILPAFRLPLDQLFA
ncbi:MAG: Uma2 family endonuclease [Vicinamibacterales bacterium]